jgi:hypothetical protein
LQRVAALEFDHRKVLWKNAEDQMQKKDSRQKSTNNDRGPKDDSSRKERSTFTKRQRSVSYNVLNYTKDGFTKQACYKPRLDLLTPKQRVPCKIDSMRYGHGLECDESASVMMILR